MAPPIVTPCEDLVPAAGTPKGALRESVLRGGENGEVSFEKL
jgi:hypothetical protein